MRFEGTVVAMAETRELTLVTNIDIDDELTAIAQSTGRDKRSLARDALVEWLEDQEDIRDAQAIIAQDNPSISLEEVKRSLGLASRGRPLGAQRPPQSRPDMAT